MGTSITVHPARATRVDQAEAAATAGDEYAPAPAFHDAPTATAIVAAPSNQQPN